MAVRNCEEVGENLQNIVKRLLANQRLCKLLHYTDKDPLAQPDIADTMTLLHNEVKIIPLMGALEDARSQISIQVVKGESNAQNDEFSDLYLNIEVFIPITQWIVKSDNLRPFMVMGEIQKSLRGKTINGLGKITGGSFFINYVTEEVTCYELVFKITVYE